MKFSCKKYRKELLGRLKERQSDTKILGELGLLDKRSEGREREQQVHKNTLGKGGNYQTEGRIKQIKGQHWHRNDPKLISPENEQVVSFSS